MKKNKNLLLRNLSLPVLLSMFIIGCDGKEPKEVVKTNNVTPAPIQTIPDPVPQQPAIPVSRSNYSFVIVKYHDKFYSEKIQVMASGIFETPEYLSEDDKYKLLDEAQTEMLKFEVTGNIISRNLKTFTSYSEASKERENILNISNEEKEAAWKADAAAAAAEEATKDAEMATKDAAEY